MTKKKLFSVLASQHAARIYAEASCKIPKLRIIAVQGDASKTYVPHCTQLHRCGDDTGCCGSDTRTCVPKTLHEIDLYFYVSTVLLLKSKHIHTHFKHLKIYIKYFNGIWV